MSHAKFNFGEDQDNNASKKQPDDAPVNENYPAEGNVRNVCFVLEDGRRFFINYAYLISGECNTENTEIVLSFTTHTIQINGTGLEKLFYQLMNSSPKQIKCDEKRYVQIEQSKEYFLTQISIFKN